MAAVVLKHPHGGLTTHLKTQCVSESRFPPARSDSPEIMTICIIFNLTNNNMMNILIRSCKYIYFHVGRNCIN